MTKPTILIVDDDASIRLVISQTLSADGYAVRATGSISALHKWIREGEGDAVITDVYLGEDCIFDLLPALKLERPELPFIVMSGQNTILTAASASEHGAFDYLPKPFDIDTLCDLVGRALDKQSITISQLDSSVMQAERDASLPLIGRSEVMQEVYRIISRVMNMRLPVLIEGETGTGKQLAAHAIHELGKYSQTRFFSLTSNELEGANLSALFESLGQDENATLFIDEIGALSADAQSSLMGVLSKFEGLRYIVATHMDIEDLVDQGAFRKDLFYRLSTVRLKLPPLRTRKEDIAELAEAFLVRAQRDGLPVKHFAKDALDVFKAYNWPGNVRELENTIYRACALSPDKAITPDEIESILFQVAVNAEDQNEGFESELHKVLQAYKMPELLETDISEENKIYSKVCDTVDKSLINMALSATNGNKVRAAALLGMNRNTLRAKIKALGIEA